MAQFGHPQNSHIQDMCNADSKTTIMISKAEAYYSEDIIRSLVDESGFKGHYEIVRMPESFCKSYSVNAVLCFQCVLQTRRCTQMLREYDGWGRRTKIMNTNFTALQLYAANMSSVDRQSSGDKKGEIKRKPLKKGAQLACVNESDGCRWLTRASLSSSASASSQASASSLASASTQASLSTKASATTRVSPATRASATTQASDTTQPSFTTRVSFPTQALVATQVSATQPSVATQASNKARASTTSRASLRRRSSSLDTAMRRVKAAADAAATCSVLDCHGYRVVCRHTFLELEVIQ